MASFNEVLLMGNVTRDIELTYTSSGMAIAKLGLATNKKRKDKEDKVCFVDLTAFGKSAEILAQYITKGSPLFIKGELDYQTWEKDGQKRSKLEVIVNEFQFLGGKSDSGSGESVNPDDIPF
jgi:single-strand DNA-binding protein